MFDAHLAVSILIIFLTRRLQTTFLKDFKKISFETTVNHINENMKLLDKIRRKREERLEKRKIGERTRARKQRKHKKCVDHSISPILPSFYKSVHHAIETLLPSILTAFSV